MNYKRNKWTKHADFIILDLLCMESALLCANAVRFEGNFFDRAYGELAFVSALLFVCLIFFTEPHSDILRRGYLRELRSVVLTNALLAGLLAVYLFVTHRSLIYSRIMSVTFIVFRMCFMYVERVLWKRWIRRRTYRSRRMASLVLVTEPGSAEKCVNRMQRTPFGEVRLGGIILLAAEEKDAPPKTGEAGQTGTTETAEISAGEKDTERWQQEAAAGQEDRTVSGTGEGKTCGIPVVGTEKDLVTYCKANVVDDVLFYGCEDKLRKYAEVLTDMGIRVHMNLAQVEEDCRKYRVNYINGIMVLTSSPVQTSEWSRLAKRLMDIVGGLVGSVVTILLTLILAPIIKIQSPGPVFFRQTRIGKNGRKFQIYKFRSMYMDAEERKKELMAQNKMQGLMFKMDDDPRIYPFGHFLRNTSLDEFPQFFNVLKGEMSLVGTRPPTVDEYEQYLPHHKSRLAMKPGITGLWQVSGRSDITDFEEVVRLDNQYIRNWSLGLDLKILFKTVIVLVKGKGAV